MIKNYLVILLTFSVLFISGCGDKEEGKAEITNKVKEANKIPSFNLITTNNKAINLTIENDKWIFKGYENKVILLNFFATWCPPCKAEIPHLVNLQNKYKNNFQVISVLLEQGKSTSQLKEFIKEYNINYTIVNSNENYNIAKAIGGVKSIPTMFIINKNGKIMEKYIGAVPEEMIEIDIKKGIDK